MGPTTDCSRPRPAPASTRYRGDLDTSEVKVAGTNREARYTTALEFIVEALREDILTDRLEPGQKLPLDALADRFGTSVIPIREALRVLEAERLVERRPHRTAVVAT